MLATADCDFPSRRAASSWLSPHRLGDGRRLLHVVQIPPLEILHQRQQRRVLLPHLRNEARQLPQAGELRRPKTPLAGPQLVVPASGAHRGGLQDAVLADAGRQLLQTLGVKIAAGLVGVGYDALQRDILHPTGEKIAFQNIFHAKRLLFPKYNRQTGKKCGKFVGKS